MDLEKKLKEFEESCLGLASNEAVRLKQEIEKEIDEQIKTELEEYQARKQWNFNKTIEKLEKDYMKEVYKYQTDCKKEILNAKKEIFKDLKIEVIKRLEEFTNTDDYNKYLLDTINQALSISNSNEKVIIGITSKDYSKYKDQISKEKNVEIKEIDNKYIGGCTVETESVFIDNTLKNNIEEKMID